jgi:hypothetical protein
MSAASPNSVRISTRRLAALGVGFAIICGGALGVMYVKEWLEDKMSPL